LWFGRSSYASEGGYCVGGGVGGGSGPSDNCSGSAPCPLTDWSRTDSFHIIWLIVLIFFLFFQWVSSVFNSPVRMATTWVSSPRDRVALQPKKGNELFLSFLFFVSDTDVEIQAQLRAHCSACHCSACPLLCVPLLCVPLLCVPTALRAHCSSFDQFR
jgi:hypothetical protein